MQPNKFKTISNLFLNHFDIKLEINEFLPPLKVNKIYQKDKRRSDKISLLFIKSLHKIQSMLLNQKPPIKQYKLFSQHTASINSIFIRNDYDFMKYNLNNKSNIKSHEIGHNNKTKNDINPHFIKQESNKRSFDALYQRIPSPQKVKMVSCSPNMYHQCQNKSISPPSPCLTSSSQTYLNLNKCNFSLTHFNDNLSKPFVIDVPANNNCKISYRISFNPIRIEQSTLYY